ncbi:kinase-like protein [Dendrothele bispora CBS 962.96]|uniref:Kinase-like protein n=1 Tax=Dendrothele bispora (strain CBS 962.96) TaxID=1314807 RepID=A0A4S8LYU0_DENBC|nr:kinase-like protein [Dendrothele bispora CBS 962.96]
MEAISIADLKPSTVGGFSEVYIARLAGKTVAVKKLRQCQESSSLVRQKFIREAMITQVLDHDNIIPFVSVVDRGPNLSIVTRWMANGNLVEYLKKHPWLPLEMRDKLVYQTAKGLDYIHERYIIHADIKGANVLVDDTGTARIADFGNAFYAFEKALLKSGGTERWMAPELILYEEDVRPSFALDIFSFAMCMYEASTITICGTHTHHFLLDIQWECPVRVQDVDICDIMISDAMWALVQDCWTQEPDKRPTAKQVSERIAAIVIV